ncbi:hypothetical protein D9615_000885 [Tricholomella constricta]|uniref:Amidohydrolase-related domain-containing protein n=1 Tax=Tricholomella constricta TaxID=117010 RepID=A0A8H5M8Q9_9AGAR|nr:hypothetical protein D9615_000885 [Tricholomella constricta]
MVFTSPTPVTGNSSPSTLGKVYHVLAGKLFDSVSKKLISNQVITVDRDSGIILRVLDLTEFRSSTESRRWVDNGTEEEIIDLTHLTILPGFVDTHVHLFLHSYAETSWTDQLTKESLPERTLRAGVHARKTLMAGFTTVRDLGTEGAEDADIALRKCLAVLPGKKEPIIPGPRYYCAGRAIVSTGSYGPKSSLFPSKNVIEGVTGAEAADGVDECIKTVRKQVGAGADWIKIYADYRIRSRLSDVSLEMAGTSSALFNKAELEAMITTAHNLGVKVAAHANNSEVMEQLLDLGVDSIEHGGNLFDDSRGTALIKKWAESGGKTVWVPTLAVFSSLERLGFQMSESWDGVKRGFQKAVEVGGVKGAKPGGKGIRVACGGDTGAFPHGENGLEMVLMRKLGVDWTTVLSLGTLGGWECCRGMEWEGEKGRERLEAVEANVAAPKESEKSRLERGVPFGAVRKGWAGDLVGVEGALNQDVANFERAIMHGVNFVMKGGAIYKMDGKEIIQ